MAKDILLTEEEQAERIKDWWKQNGSSVVTGCVLGVALVVGVNYWRGSQNTSAEAASEIYNTLAEAQDGADQADTFALAATLKNDYSGTPYASKAALIEAREFVEQGNLGDAVESLLWAMENTDESGVVHAARLRVARIRIEQGQLDEAAALLELDDYQGFDSQYYELMGDIARLRGDTEGADMHYGRAIENIGENAGYAGIITIKKKALSAGVKE
jgi:predicted negative regulator of RcsB-dependent stress response